MVDDNKLLYHSQVLKDLGSIFTPHQAQIEIGKALFYDGKKKIFLQCGRKFGKSEFLIYSLYRWCLLYPNSWCYYFAPFKDQISDLVWSNNRLPGFLPEKLMKKYGVNVNNSDRRVTFRNGSFIKADGCDNYSKSRGYSATGLSVIDEMKDVHPEFLPSFEPNLAITDAPIMMVGTPPSEDEGEVLVRWQSIVDDVKRSPVGYFTIKPSTSNPHVSKEFFIRKRAELIEKGEEWLWRKEYLAEIVNAGSSAIFPMMDKDKHIRPYDEIKSEILNNHEDWDFFISFDPGSATVFGVLLAAMHKYSKKVYMIDEIYADNFATNSAGIVTEKARLKILEIMPDIERWSGVYDYAAAWYFNEYQTNYDFGLFLNPCEKDLKQKENKLSLIKDMLLGGFFVMSDRCTKLWWEMKSYRTDEHGKIKKENDHLIDNSRYILNAMRYDKIPQDRPKTEAEIVGDRRKITIEDDLSNLRSGDIYGSIDSDLYDN